MTDDIAAVARQAASAGTEVLAVTPRFGPASVESILEAHIAAVGIIDAAARHAPGCDAVVLAGFGELGREALQELLEVPVVDITEAAAHMACLVGRVYGVVTTLGRSVPGIEDRLTLAGLARPLRRREGDRDPRARPRCRPRRDGQGGMRHGRTVGAR